MLVTKHPHLYLIYSPLIVSNYRKFVPLAFEIMNSFLDLWTFHYDAVITSKDSAEGVVVVPFYH